MTSLLFCVRFRSLEQSATITSNWKCNDCGAESLCDQVFVEHRVVIQESVAKHSAVIVASFAVEFQRNVPIESESLCTLMRLDSPWFCGKIRVLGLWSIYPKKPYSISTLDQNRITINHSNDP